MPIVRAGAASFAEEVTVAERGKKKNGAKMASVFLFVGTTGQLSNRFIKDLIALKALLDLIE